MFVVLLFEILYESNLRMPQYFGMAMSIVGALILGDAAVSASIVSPIVIIIVAVAIKTNITIPFNRIFAESLLVIYSSSIFIISIFLLSLQ